MCGRICEDFCISTVGTSPVPIVTAVSGKRSKQFLIKEIVKKRKKSEEKSK